MSLNVYRLKNFNDFVSLCGDFQAFLISKGTAEIWNKLVADATQSLQSEKPSTTEKKTKERLFARIQEYYAVSYQNIMRRIALDCDPYIIKVFAVPYEKGTVLIYCRTANSTFYRIWNEMDLTTVPASILPLDEEGLLFSSVLCTGQRLLNEIPNLLESKANA